METDQNEAIVFQQEVARLEALLEASRQVHGALKLDDVLHSSLEIATKELEAEGAFFIPSEALANATRTFYGNVPPTWSMGQHPEEWEGSSIVPLHDNRGGLLTNLVLLRPGRPLTFEEEDFLEGLALQSAVAVENARHHERLLAWERVQQDLAAARAIQRSLLPQRIPQIGGYGLNYRSQPCFEVGGDYVDIVASPEHKFVMIVADVAGKGLASAIVSASFRAAFRAMVTASLPLEELAARMNELHYEEGPETRRRYVTAIVLSLDAVRHELEILNAGHNPGFLINDDGDYYLLGASGPPFGMLPGVRYSVERHLFTPRGKLLFYTDGLTEVFREDEEFGVERLLEFFRTSAERDCGVLLEELWGRLDEFAPSTEQTDDMTALALIRGESGESASE